MDEESDCVGHIQITKEELMKEMLNFKDHDPQKSIYVIRVAVPDTVCTDC